MVDSSIDAKMVDLTRFSLRKHVQDAFLTALALADSQGINAAHALLAALSMDRSAGSTSFLMLAKLLPVRVLEKRFLEKIEMAPPENLKALPLYSPLAEAFSIAEPFLERVDAVRGRDYITLVLLAVNDPSLREIAASAGTTLEVLQDEWFQFVTTDKRYREREEWEAWWRAAGVPLPEERISAEQDQSESVQQPEEKTIERDVKPTSSLITNTYLLTWDPARHSINYLEDAVQEIKQKGKSVMNWSVGNKGIKPGNRVFFMRHGKEQPGLVGSGYVISEPEEHQHWDKEAPPDWTAFYADIEWDVLRELPLIPLKILVDRTAERDLWTAHGSGFPIEQGLAERLEILWQEALAAQSEPTPSAKDPLEKFKPRVYVVTDRPSEQDSLNVTQQAEIFATLLIAEHVKPPFALGLLGDWGVGKTTFMRLMQKKIAAILGRDGGAGRTPGSVSRAAQIEFNAWHYVDSDLWASLASRIYDGLSEELHGRPDEVEVTRRRLRQEIDSSIREKKEAEAAIKAAEQQRQEAAQALIDSQKERDRLAEKCDKLRLQRVWKAVLEVKPNTKIEEQRNWPNLEEMKTKAEETAKRLGITEAINDAKEAQRVYTSLCELYQRGAGLAAAFASFSGKDAWFNWMVLFLLLAIVVICPWILKQIETLLDTAHSPRLLTHFLQLITIIGSAAVWAGKNLKSISSSMSYLEKITDEIRHPRLPLEGPTDKEKKFKKEIEALDTGIATEKRKIEQADRQIAEAQSEIQRINAGGLVYDFLAGRVRDSRYLDRLGLISVIRQDFEKLGSLLHDWEKHGAGTDPKTAQSSAGSNLRPIERIILYIDDLDRCPPKRVVEVLQAVHLLLAFDLFVVVVAVDARWLERSLNEQYNPADIKLAGSLPNELHRFSAHNYLEKIFQIPFHLPAMSAEGYQQLVSDMIAMPRTQAANAAETTGLQQEARKDRVDTKGGDEPSGPTSTDGEVHSSVSEESAPVTKEERRSQEELDRLKAEQRQREQEEADKLIKTMLLEKWEENFMAALFPFIHTPRLTNRFVNIYRLLRVRASMLTQDFSTFMGPGGDYRAVLILLSINVGYPDVAPEIIEHLGTAKRDSFCDWFEEELSRWDSEDIVNKEQQEVYNRKIRMMEIQQAIGLVKAELMKPDGPRFDDRLAIYRQWAPEVGRYSFHCHRKKEKIEKIERK